MYYTNVIKNDELFMFAENTDKFKKRDCFLLLQHFFSESYDGKVLIIYGLPNTGKTTLMLQKIKMLPKERVVYIKITEADKEGLINFDQYGLILRYLQDLDLLENYSEYYEKYSQGEIQIYTYPTMINVVSKEYIHDILLDKYFD